MRVDGAIGRERKDGSREMFADYIDERKDGPASSLQHAMGRSFGTGLTSMGLAIMASSWQSSLGTWKWFAGRGTPNASDWLPIGSFPFLGATTV